MDRPIKTDDLELNVELAQAGNRLALENVITAIEKDIYNLALRFLSHPEDAEDAKQEILVRVVTSLGQFRGDSAFRTWVYRVASNKLLTIRKYRMELTPLSFEAFGEDLEKDLADYTQSESLNIDHQLLLEEVKIGCTSAMLICLDRAHRLAYILGEIIELDHNEAAEVLELTTAAYRKRLSRARARITDFMISHCGLANPENACRCHRKVNTAIKLGRVNPDNLIFSTSIHHAKQFPDLLVKIRALEETRRVSALYRSHPQPESQKSFLPWLHQLFENEHLKDLVN